MHTRFTLPRRLFSALVVVSFSGLSSAQSGDVFEGVSGFEDALACPANVQPTAAADGGATGGGGGTAETQPFDYSLIQRKRQQLASQQGSRSSKQPTLAELQRELPRFGPLTGRQKKLLAQAAAGEAARFAQAVTNIGEEAPADESYYQSQPEETQPEEPMVALPPLSTALANHAIPLQMQNMKATTGVNREVEAMVTAAASRPQTGRAHDPKRTPSRAQAILSAHHV